MSTYYQGRNYDNTTVMPLTSLKVKSDTDHIS
jgi:hypothetical protein